MPTTSTSADSNIGGDPIRPPTDAAATFFDGVTNRKHAVTLRLGDAALDIFEDRLGIASWPYADIRLADGGSDVLRLSSASALPLARLEVRDEILRQDLVGRCGQLRERRRTSPQETWRVVGWSIGAIASIVLVTLYGVPLAAERLAPLIPQSFENRLGEMADKQVGTVFGRTECTSPAGVAAFQKLVNELRAAGGLDTAVKASVVNTGILNAFALPGGKVYLFNALLQRAETPDELAGVLAHELGHVKHRDHMRGMIQNGGTSFLVGLLFGDVTGAGAAVFATRTVLNASYSRGAETQADQFAIDVMHKLGRSPKPLGEFLFRIAGKSGGRAIGILASHPMTEDRREMTRRADRPNTGPDLLSADEWRALKAICRR